MRDFKSRYIYLTLFATFSIFLYGCIDLSTLETITYEPTLDEGKPGVEGDGSRPSLPIPTPYPTNTPMSINELTLGFTENGNPYIGDLDAPFVIEEFSGYQCPSCKRFYNEEMPELKAELIARGEIVYIFRDFPLNRHHAGVAAANAAHCAGEQSVDAYWAMHDTLFNLRDWTGKENPSDILIGYASDLGINNASFETCVRENRYANQILADRDEGTERGIRATPSFLINGDTQIYGGQSTDVFSRLINSLKYSMTRQPIALEAEKQDRSQQLETSTRDSFAIGDEDAPVTIVEFTDYQCPFCARHYANTFDLIKTEYVDQGLVRYVFQDFPLKIHPQGKTAAQAARCAKDQGAFMEMHDTLFTNQKEWSGKSEVNDIFNSYAEDLGLITRHFEPCLSSDQHAQVIEDAITTGTSLRVTHTPFFFINGQVVAGDQPFSVFQSIIDAELEN